MSGEGPDSTDSTDGPDGTAGPGGTDGPDAAAQRRTSSWERARRRAEVFGETLPETTSDERDTGSSRGPRDADTWLIEQVPPHHGD